MTQTDGWDASRRGAVAGVARARADARSTGPPDDDAGSALRDGTSPLADLRPVGPAAVLDGGFEFFRFRFRRLVGLAAVLFVPITMIDLLLMAVIGTTSTDRTAIGPATFMLASGDSWSWFIVAAQTCALSILGLCVGHLAMQAALGRDVTSRELRRLALRRSWVAVLIVVLVAVPRGLLSCVTLLLGWLLADAFFFVSSSAAGAEGLGPWKAVVRSGQLTRARFGNAILICLGSLVVSQILRLSLTAGPALLLSSFGLSDLVVGIVSRLGSLILLLAEPITACIAARAYLDLRARRDGLDLELRAGRVFDHDPLLSGAS